MLKIIECVPMLNHVILTANRYEESDFNESLIDDEQKLVGNIKEYQTVVSVGPYVKDLKAGDFVVVNPKAYAKPIHKTKDTSVRGLLGDDEVEMRIEFPTIEINGIPHLFLYDRDIDMVITKHEFINDSVSNDDKLV